LKVDESLIDYGLSITKKLGASYSAIKISDFTSIGYQVSNKNKIYQSNSVPGFHVRVIVNGAWGFSGSTEITKKEMNKSANMAVKIAKHNALSRETPVKLAENIPVQDHYKTPVKKDAFKVDPSDYYEILEQSVNEAKGQSKYIKNSSASVTIQREQRLLGTSEGASIKQELDRTSCGLTVTAMKNGMIQSAGLGSNFATRGFEWVEINDLPKMGREEGLNAGRLVEAKRCPDEKTSIIIEDRMLSLQIHETLGHCTELDRILQTEVDFVGPIGKSFFSPDEIGKLWFGSEEVNIVADATIEGGQGTFGYDDEGVPAKKTYIIKEGILAGLQSSRETAAEAGFKESSGQYLGTYGYDQPVVRMTNINLLPGDWKRDELIEDTKDGILMSGYNTEIFDQRRTTFGFGAQKAWKIKNGELTEMYRDPTYYGTTTPFWRTCDGISSDNWGLGYGGGCGKCRPGQSGRVGHFCSSARFHNVHVGGGGVYE
jgi:TldD protein